MPEARWYYARDGEPVGPVPAVELRRMAAAGELSELDWVCCEGWPDWAPAGRVKGLFPGTLDEQTVPHDVADRPAASPGREVPLAAASCTSVGGGSRHLLLSEAHVVPDASRCVQCGICSYNCPMGIDVRAHAWRGQPIHDSHCLTCSECVKRCPRGVLRFDRIGLFAAN